MTAPKPEAPWIKRCDFGIKFTDEIHYTEFDENSDSDKKDKQKLNKNAQNRTPKKNKDLDLPPEPLNVDLGSDSDERMYKPDSMLQCFS
jgi:hypothetical protein